MNMGDLEIYNGYLLVPGITMPSYDIEEVDVYNSVGAYRQNEPAHSTENILEAKRWIDEQPAGTITEEDYTELLKESLTKMPFWPEPGEPLPEYVAEEIYPQAVLEVMVLPVSEYGRQVAADTAKGYKEFLEGGGFIVRSKLEESAWSSEDVGYSGNIVHLPSGNSYAVFVHVFFDWRSPTENVVRFLNIWEEVEEGAPEVLIWEGDLDRSGGVEASKAIAEFEVTGRGI